MLHYMLYDGAHPYGPLTSPISVDSNIRAGHYSLLMPDQEARHLLTWMITPDPAQRKDINVCLTWVLLKVAKVGMAEM